MLRGEAQGDHRRRGQAPVGRERHGIQGMDPTKTRIKGTMIQPVPTIEGSHHHPHRESSPRLSSQLQNRHSINTTVSP